MTTNPGGEPPSHDNPVPVILVPAPASGFKVGEPVSSDNPMPVQISDDLSALQVTVLPAGVNHLGEGVSIDNPLPVFQVEGQISVAGEPYSSTNPVPVVGLVPPVPANALTLNGEVVQSGTETVVFTA
jgi:hypothetical protein